MSVVEILIIATLFIWFLAEPEWSIWRTNWFVNKVFVLAAFVLVLSTALFRPETLKANSPIHRQARTSSPRLMSPPSTVAHADIKELPSLNDPFKDVVFIVLRAQREAVFEGGVVGDNRGYVLKRLGVNVTTDTLPAVNLAGQ